VNVSQLESEAALHVHVPLVFVTVTANAPPPEGAAWAVDARLYPQAVAVGAVVWLLLQAAAARMSNRGSARPAFMNPSAGGGNGLARRRS
jgi:hypothetical protein